MYKEKQKVIYHYAAGLLIPSSLLQFEQDFKVCKKLDREIYEQRELSHN